MKIVSFCVTAFIAFSLAACYRAPEMTLSEIEAARSALSNDLVQKTVSRPYKNNGHVPGQVGGTWNTSILGDPKSFNLLIAEKDAETLGVLEPMHEYLSDYNVYTREWLPHIASFRVEMHEDSGTMDIYYTIRDDAYWSYYNNAKPRVPVTSDDVVFWYDEIQGDADCGSSMYNAQFMPMEDGSSKRITIEKIDEKSFVFHYPRIVAEPLLSSNMEFAPSFLYKPAKEKGGADGVKKLFTVASDPKELPSCGPYFLVEYIPGQRLVYKRNADYWEKDANGESHFYPEERIVQIVGDMNTTYMMFKQGTFESYSPTPEQMEDIVNNANNMLTADGTPIESDKKSTDGYTVFNAAGSMGAPFWSFNQNPKNKDETYYNWFVKKEFRQAMSCLLNRERIIQQTYRGLGEPKYTFFPEANKYYDENIMLQYRYSHTRAQKLLEAAGFSRHEDGFLYDADGNQVSFDLSFISSSAVVSDIVQIIVDECKKEGITITPRPTDFQKLVDQLMSTYDWQTLIIGLTGGAVFPTQGSNVWVSDGNLHLWHPLQEKPATDWEARIDYLYHEAACIMDYEKAKPYWDEYQQILLEQCPVIYLIRSRTFFALQNRWDMTNVYYDNLEGAEIRYLYLK
ncbi:MAG: ABC transporter substrate-binding protein [Treponema sp.]|nr:ABC transporter substrate-binding protein [Treponema sp.]